ncbi:MAG: EamA family transporter [Candidatus Omnitrophota bacterium]
MPDKRLTLKIISLLIFSDVLETFTHFCFKKSTLTQFQAVITDIPQAFGFLSGVFSSHFLWMGILSVVLTFILWSAVLSRIDLSVAVPVASSSYIFVPLVSIIALGEKISLMRWLGIILIVLGVVFVSKSTSEKGASVK